MTLQEITRLIQQRRSVFPAVYIPGKTIERDLLEQVLENANWAPNHKLTQPWRFQVFHSEESRRELGQYLGDFYQNNTDKGQISEVKYKKMLENPVRAGAVIAIIMQREAAESLPEFEEIAAVAMAVQNMWLTCAAAGLGAYWSSPSAILKADAFLGLEPGQRCLGLFYMGWSDAPEIPGKRDDIGPKVTWR